MTLPYKGVHAELCEIFDAVGVDEEKMSEI